MNTCQARISPDCNGNADHTHHLLLRSQGGEDGPTIKVCLYCHSWIHANPAESYARGLLIKSWAYDLGNRGVLGEEDTGVLDAGERNVPAPDLFPPVGGTTDVGNDTPSSSPSTPEVEHALVGVGGVRANTHVESGQLGGAPCPRCHGTGHVPEPKPKEKTRQKVTYAIRVPKDERENGYEVLDTLIVECSDVLGYSGTRGSRYFTLVKCLAWFLQTYNPEREEES